MLRAYPARASVFPGQELVLHVAGDTGRFRVLFYRWGATPVLQAVSRWRNVSVAAEHSCAAAWHWPACCFRLPRHWVSGVYVARLVGPDSAPEAPRLDLDQGAALFVVRGPGRAPVLYKLPLSTWQAYNHSGGGCFYDQPISALEPPGAKVTLHRPGGGIGAPVFGSADHYDPGSPRQSFAHWDAPFIAWLEAQGITAEYCTDLDVHHDAALPARHRVLVTAGHDEYWSGPTRAHTAAYVAAGGNLAIFGGNTCWWRTTLVDGDTALVCHQGGPQGARDLWWTTATPEEQLTGLSYRHGGGWWDGPRTVAGYAVCAPDHWVFAGTGLARGALLGAASTPPLVGYECDGLDPAVPDARVTVLATCALTSDWQELPARAGWAAGDGPHNAAMILMQRGGLVFNTGTTDWPQVLASGRDGQVTRITRNVLRRLAGLD